MRVLQGGQWANLSKLERILTHEHSGFLEFPYLNILISLQQLDLVTHLTGQSITLVGFLNVIFIGPQEAPSRHAKVVSGTGPKDLTKIGAYRIVPSSFTPSSTSFSPRPTGLSSRPLSAHLSRKSLYASASD